MSDAAGVDVLSKKNTKHPKAPEDYPAEVKRIAWDLAGLIAQRLPETPDAIPRQREANAKRWCDSIDKLQRLDGVSYARIDEVMRWSQTNDFWQGNVLSGSKLRKKFTQLVAGMQAEAKRTATTPGRPGLTAADRMKINQRKDLG